MKTLFNTLLILLSLSLFSCDPDDSIDFNSTQSTSNTYRVKPIPERQYLISTCPEIEYKFSEEWQFTLHYLEITVNPDFNQIRLDLSQFRDDSYSMEVDDVRPHINHIVIKGSNPQTELKIVGRIPTYTNLEFNGIVTTDPNPITDQTTNDAFTQKDLKYIGINGPDYNYVSNKTYGVLDVVFHDNEIDTGFIPHAIHP